MKLSIGASFLLLLLLGCSSTPPAISHGGTHEVDIQRDLDAAKSRGDLRFIGVQGNRGELLIPGVPDFQEKYANRYRVKVIAGTSGVSLSQEDEDFKEAAWRYAEQYNGQLLQYIAAKEQQSSLNPAATRP